MTTRIPSSLKWLALKRARAADDIQRLETRREILLTEQTEIEALLAIRRQDQEALDRVIATHEVPIDPSDIPRIRFQQGKRPFRYGQMTKLIFTYLRTRTPEWSTTTEIATFLWTKLEYGAVDYPPEFHTAIRHRLKHLVQKGRLERTLGAVRHADATWRLK